MEGTLKLWPLAIVVAASTPAAAQDIRLTPLIDARVRAEHVDQAGLPDTADAVTARVRTGIAATHGKWQALAEAEATLSVVERYNSGTNDRLDHPLIVDPQNIELNRAQLRYDGAALAATAGRQRIELADQRFVGSASFRQNEQTFDALRMQWHRRSWSIDVSYARSDRTVNGIDGRGARQQAVRGDNIFALAGVQTPLGTLTGFGYLVDQDEAAVQGFRLSSQTYGVRMVGKVPITPAIGLSYTGSWARQRDWHRNPNDYVADYWLVEATAAIGPVAFTAAQEVLGADDGRALTSVQTPLASLFKFQGWADKFTTTPPNGMRDLFGVAAINWKKLGPLDLAGLSATYHRFRSDRLGQHYGEELDLLAGVKRGKISVSARLAHYVANSFAADTDKIWLEANWTL